MKNTILRTIVGLHFVLFLLASLAIRAQSVQFNSLSLNDGLSQATASCMTQDREGFIWIGTRDGLNRYDGYTFSVLQYDLTDSTSISNNTITALANDRSGGLWVGTSFGLNRLNTRTLHADSYYHWFEDSASISSNKIRALAEDKLGRLWVGTNNGLNRLDNWERNKFIRFSIMPNDSMSLSNNTINDILVDSKGRVWIGTDGGLNLYQPYSDTFIRYRKKFNDDNSLSNNNVLSLCEDKNGNLWIGTRNGLNKFNPDMGVFTRYFADSPIENLLSSNIISDLIIDNTGDLWIGSPTGLTRFSQDSKKSTQYHAGGGRINSLPNEHILSLLRDNSGMIWIGTQSAGIATLDLDAPQFFSIMFSGRKNYIPEQNQVYSFLQVDSDLIWLGTASGLAGFNPVADTAFFYSDQEKTKDTFLGIISQPIHAMARTSDSLIWMGTGGKGLIVLDLKADTAKTFLSVANDTTSISSNNIRDILVDKDENIWLATLGGGLCFLNRQTGKFKSYKFDGNKPNSIRDNNVHCLEMDPYGNICFGTGNAGLYILDPRTGILRNFNAGDPQKGFLPSNGINDLYTDVNGNLWMATSGGGIAMYNEAKNNFLSYNTNDGLANDVALSITSDKTGNLWISTNGGISAFNGQTETFRNYNEQDVLGQNTFYAQSCISTSSGTVIFGGSNGFDYFNSEGLKENLFIPPIVLTGFQVINTDERTAEVNLITSKNEKLKLEYNHSGFSLEFAALNYKQSHKNQYAYRLKGLFDKWRYIGTRRFATFSNLNPGHYTFEVIGSNNDGHWSETPATISIIVEPAFWQTAWFQIMSVIAVLGILYLFYKYKLASTKARTKMLEIAVENRTKEVVKERDTNVILLKEVHHRVKNNLQIIVSLLNLQSRFISDSKLLDVFGEIQNRVRSMSLIHEKMYKTKDLKTVNIAEYITDLSESLLSTYRLSQQVELDVNVEVNSFKSDTLTPLGLIINEVITNALKYAFQEDRHGRIFVTITKLDEKRFRMLIGDDGIGIPKSSAMGNTDSFGTELISALTEQLEGSIQLLPGKGTVYEVIFRDVED